MHVLEGRVGHGWNWVEMGLGKEVGALSLELPSGRIGRDGSAGIGHECLCLAL